MMSQAKSSNLGYPRIGEKREWKKLLEAHWAGKIDAAELESETKKLRLEYLKKQRDLKTELIPVGDFSLYDHMLDTAFTFGLVPQRFTGGDNTAKHDGDCGCAHGSHDEEPVASTDSGTKAFAPDANGAYGLDAYFAVARGTKAFAASPMTKWFDTNYHYIVPELQGLTPKLTVNRPLAFYLEAKEELGIDGKPVLVGPLTLLKLARGIEEDRFDTLLDQLIPLYAQVLKELSEAGAKWVQIDEPVLVLETSEADIARLNKVYEAFRAAAPELNILLQTYFESVSRYQDIVQLPVQAIGLDFVHDRGRNLAAIEQYGFPQDKILGAGVIDGRNIWRSDLKVKLDLLRRIQQAAQPKELFVQPSSSLLHVPVTTRSEQALEAKIRNGLSFADEKLTEIAVLVKALNEGEEAAAAAIAESVDAVAALNASPERNDESVRDALGKLDARRPERLSPYAVRRDVQAKHRPLPLLPTTTIGSLPQTTEVRQARSKWKKGEWSEEQYVDFLHAETERWIRIQEEIGIDVLVHGEFERNDMVEYFGEQLAGFTTSGFAWVQSYGSRCVKPPILYGDVKLLSPMTVTESAYAQSLTDKPVKGMLTGPITIYNWSFVRDDLPRAVVQNQIALALRSEVSALEEAGIGMIQVDEPALREGLPLKREDWQDYLDDAVYAFRASTTSVQDETQIHTHMCYAEFGDIIQAISDLDADVISIEAARSHGDLVTAFEDHTYDKGIGLGVFDIHSPRLPEPSEIESIAKRALEVLDPAQFWINPDCGLKTRREEEVIPSLKTMVAAAAALRQQFVGAAAGGAGVTGGQD